MPYRIVATKLAVKLIVATISRMRTLRRARERVGWLQRSGLA